MTTSNDLDDFRALSKATIQTSLQGWINNPCDFDFLGFDHMTLDSLNIGCETTF